MICFQKTYHFYKKRYSLYNTIQNELPSTILIENVLWFCVNLQNTAK